MTWRKHQTHAEETKAVKAALRDAGFEEVRVTHGSGTSWAWLHVKIAAPRTLHRVVLEDHTIAEMTRREKGHLPYHADCIGGCGACAEVHDLRCRATALVANVTGRTGDYHGETIIEVVDPT